MEKLGIIRKIFNSFGIQLMSIHTYSRMMKILTDSRSENKTLHQEIQTLNIKNIHKQEKLRILTEKIDSFDDRKLSKYIHSGTLNNDAFNAIETYITSHSDKVSHDISSDTVQYYRSLLTAEEKAASAIDYLNSNDLNGG